MVRKSPVCQLCGVHFNLARIRRIDEPLSLETAWHPNRPPWPPLNLSEVKSRPYVNVKKSSKPHPACEAAGCSNQDGDHAAGGPSCGVEDGYNGWRISAQEMGMITRVQCLVLKYRRRQRPPDNDETADFEFESEDWCLTAVSRGSAGRDRALKIPYIRGIGGDIDTCNYYADWRISIGFHPSCFQIYKRVCMRKKGKVDIDCIGEFRKMCRSAFMAQNLVDGHRDVLLCSSGGTWEHIPGTEWLAADPLTIPRLQALVDECTLSQNYSQSKTSPRCVARGQDQKLPTHESPTHVMTQSRAYRSRDPFLNLPAEVKSIIIEFLEQDIEAVASLRLSSRAFNQLPAFFYRTLIVRLMPCVWEVQDLIARKLTVDWQKLWTELCRVDGFLQVPVERQGRYSDEPKNCYFDYVAEQRRWSVCRLHKEIPTKSGSELWEKALNNYVKVEEVTILGLKNRTRVWRGCEALIDYADEHPNPR